MFKIKINLCVYRLLVHKKTVYTKINFNFNFVIVQQDAKIQQYICLISIGLSFQQRLLELDIAVKDLEPESPLDMEDEPPDVDTLFGFLDPKISDTVHVSPGTTVYGVSSLSCVATNIHLI
jgi:NAD-dependent oxidoreductase involved in siderophore biosynthesis